ncbi:MAG: restriction endonuclease [Desulfosalsimonadaceae bacterium]
MAAYRENLLELLVDAPWWVSASLAAAVLVLLKYILPEVFTGNSLAGALAGGLAEAAWLVALIVFIPAPVSIYNTWKKNRLLNGQEDPSGMTRLSRRAFTQLVQAVYARNGYRLKPYTDPTDQAEVDMMAKKNGETVLLQYRHHKSGQIEKQAVEAMLDRLQQDDARQAHIISCSGFSQEAAQLARNSSVRLLDADSLEAMLRKGLR